MTRAQRRNARIIIRVGRRMGAPRHVIRSALATGLVESNLRNLRYGDRDSVGVFQQRRSQGWRGLRNVRRASKEYYRQAMRNYRRGKRRGALAQSVQRSAFPGRYDQQWGRAGRLMRGGGGGRARKRRQRVAKYRRGTIRTRRRYLIAARKYRAYRRRHKPNRKMKRAVIRRRRRYIHRKRRLARMRKRRR